MQWVHVVGACSGCMQWGEGGIDWAGWAGWGGMRGRGHPHQQGRAVLDIVVQPLFSVLLLSLFLVSFLTLRSLRTAPRQRADIRSDVKLERSQRRRWA